MPLSPEEQAQLDGLLAKAAEPPPPDNPEPVADAADITDAIAGAIEAGVAIGAAVVNEAREDEAERLAAEADAAKVEAAVAEMNAEAAVVEAGAVVADLIEPALEIGADEEPGDEPDITVGDDAHAVIVDAAPGADVSVDDSANDEGVHPYFQPMRMFGGGKK